MYRWIHESDLLRLERQLREEQKPETELFIRQRIMELRKLIGIVPVRTPGMRR